MKNAKHYQRLYGLLTMMPQGNATPSNLSNKPKKSDLRVPLPNRRMTNTKSLTGTTCTNSGN